jgi:hypothetical protein
MTADDFFLLSIALGGFSILALLLWSFARIADRKQDKERGPDVRSDVDSPGAPNGHGRKETARSDRANDDFLPRRGGWAVGHWAAAAKG